MIGLLAFYLCARLAFVFVSVGLSYQNTRVKIK